MAETLPGFESPETSSPRPRPAGRIVRVQPDITSVTRSFDYLVPTPWEVDGRADRVRVGSLVRVDFSGRRTAGWVTEVDVDFDPSIELRPLVKWSSHGPPDDVVDLARWAAWRWAGRLPHLLRAASPPRMVTTLRAAPPVPARVDASDAAKRAFVGALTLVRTTPGDDSSALALAAASHGSALILVPTISQRHDLVRSLRSRGVEVAEYDEQWERSAGGGITTVGTRTGALAPMPTVDAVLVIDEHATTYKEERTPAWNARDVAIERARRAGVPCVLTSPAPSLEALTAAERQLVPERSVERNSWPLVEVVDLRDQDQPGLLTEAIVDAIRGPGPVACVVNRKGRARMLACVRCNSLAACEECGGALREDDDGRLTCARDGTTRPMVCAECKGTRMKQLRLGVSRLAEDLAALAKRDVMEVTAETPQRQFRGDQLFVGTEALLYRLEDARAIIFLDFDQELAVPRIRAGEEAFALLALAARRLGPKSGGGKLIIQTHRPDDVVVQAALSGDPGRVAKAQRDVRQVFQQPPYGVWALLSGAGAEEYVAAVHEFIDGHDSPVRINRLEDRFRLTAPDHPSLLELLASVDRPAERLRIEVDPLDI